MSERVIFGSSTINTINGSDPVWQSSMFGNLQKFSFLEGQGKLLEQSILLPQTGFRLTRMVTTGHEVEIEVQGVYGLLLPLVGHVAYKTNQIELTANAGSGAIISRPNTRWASVEPRKKSFGECLIFQFPDSFGVEDGVADIRPVLGALPDMLELPFNDPANIRLGRYLRLLAEELQPDSPLPVTRKYLDGMSVLLDECLRDTLRAAHDMIIENSADLRDLTKAKAAQNIILDRFSEPLQVSEIAKELEIGIRSLQIAFKNAFDMSPREMITQVRLNQAYTRLTQANTGDQVVNIAYACGITHMGRFAQAYRRQFGESPNQTLNRVIRTPPKRQSIRGNSKKQACLS